MHFLVCLPIVAIKYLKVNPIRNYFSLYVETHTAVVIGHGYKNSAVFQVFPKTIREIGERMSA